MTNKLNLTLHPDVITAGRGYFVWNVTGCAFPPGYWREVWLTMTPDKPVPEQTDRGYREAELTNALRAIEADLFVSVSIPPTTEEKATEVLRLWSLRDPSVVPAYERRISKLELPQT